MQSWPFKDPDEVLDYEIDWATHLGTDQISTSAWIVPSGIVETSSSKTLTTTTIWLSGGTVGEAYQITNRIVTVDGRTMDWTVKLKIKEK